MKHIFLLQEVIDDLVNTDKSLSAPLMKLNYFGKLVKNQDLVEYTNSEINGYKTQEENIPSYRRTIGTLHIDMQMYIHRHSGELPVSMLDEPFRTRLRYVYIKEGIAAIEKLAKESENNLGGQIMTILPMEMLHILQKPARLLYKSNTRVDVIGARLDGNSNVIVEIPNAIRTKLLDFVMSIAENFGYDVEIETFNKKSEINNQTIIHQMNNTINNSGDGNIINTGNENQIENNINLYKNDFSRLESELEKQGIEKSDIEEITEIISSEEANIVENRLGEKSNNWISKIINKSLNGVGKIATGISANILATLIKQYYGMP